MTNIHPQICVLVRGVGEIGSAVAWHLHRAGFSCALQQEGLPATIRRTMAFSDAVFDGEAVLADVRAVRVAGAEQARKVAEAGAIPLFHAPVGEVLAALECAILVDARMHKRKGPERQLGLAALVVGLGPGCVVGGNVDIAVGGSQPVSLDVRILAATQVDLQQAMEAGSADLADRG